MSWQRAFLSLHTIRFSSLSFFTPLLLSLWYLASFWGIAMKSGVTLENDKDGKIIQSSLNINVRSYTPVVSSICRCSSPQCLSRYQRYCPQISAYSVIFEKGHKIERIGPAQLLLTSQKALTEVCAKEWANLMLYVWSSGVTPVYAYILKTQHSNLFNLLCWVPIY